jgi:hypothetical protein
LQNKGNELKQWRCSVYEQKQGTNWYELLELEVIMAMTMKSNIFPDVMLHSLVLPSSSISKSKSSKQSAGSKQHGDYSTPSSKVMNSWRYTSTFESLNKALNTSSYSIHKIH